MNEVKLHKYTCKKNKKTKKQKTKNKLPLLSCKLWLSTTILGLPQQ